MLVTSAPATGLDWPTCDPELVLSVLRNLDVAKCADGKVFFKTVFKWSDVNAAKRNKCKAFWDAQSVPVQTEMVADVNALESSIRESENKRNANTNRQDRCRLMHLFVDAEMQTLWTKALSPLEREDLDSTDSRRSAYEELAEAFNARERRQYQNLCITHENGEPINPYVSQAGMECIAQTCWDLNPNDATRPDRDATWVEKVSKDIRGVMSKAYQNYRRSGNQDAENKYFEWCRFVGNVSDVYKYCFILMPEGVLDQLGRALPESMQRDTSGRPPREYSSTPSAVNKRRQRLAQKALSNGDSGGGGGSTRTNTPSPSLGEILGEAVRGQQKQQALFHFAAHGTAEEKNKARARLASLAFESDEDY